MEALKLSFDTSLLRNGLDIAIVTWIVYRGLLLIRGTRAAPMLAGLTLIVALYFLSTWFGLLTLAWVLGSFLSSIILVIVVIFQDEIRRGLTKVGLQPIVRRQPKQMFEKTLEDITLCCQKLSKAKLGGLIVLQQDVGLDNIVEDGVIVDAQLSRKLLLSIFLKESPLHDGAVIVEGDRIKAAGCVLPLSYNPDLDPNLGTRHRAALGLSERSDAIILIVSEENGGISLAREGRLIRNLDGSLLRDALHRFLSVLPHVEEETLP
jgi:diadenylate cyclase